MTMTMMTSKPNIQLLQFTVRAMVYRFKLIESSLQQLSKLIFYQKTTYMDKRQKNNLMTTITLIVVLGQFILWIMLLLLDKV